MIHELTINDCELLVHLGWTEEEQKNKQRVLLQLKLQFTFPIMAASSDQLNDTVCYRTLIEFLRTHIATKSYALLEFLGQQLLDTTLAHLKTLLLPEYSLSLTVTKWPGIAGLTGGVSFTCHAHSKL